MTRPDVSLVRVWADDTWHDALGRPCERVLIDGCRPPAAFIHLRCSPSPGPGPSIRAMSDEHLAAGPGVRSWSWLSCADVIVRRVPELVPIEPVMDMFRAWFPGCRVVAITREQASRRGRGSAVVTTGSGWRARLVPVRERTRADDDSGEGDGAEGDGADGGVSEADLLAYASVIHAWITFGRPLGALEAARLTVVRGDSVRRTRCVVVMTEGRRRGGPARWGAARRAGS